MRFSKDKSYKTHFSGTMRDTAIKSGGYYLHRAGGSFVAAASSPPTSSVIRQMADEPVRKIAAPEFRSNLHEVDGEQQPPPGMQTTTPAL